MLCNSMTPDQVQQIVQHQIANLPDAGHPHGVVLTRCLVKPFLVDAHYPGPSAGEVKVWIVLEETIERDGYKIYFDPAASSFGLASNGFKGLELLGLYGDFVDALAAM